MRLEFTVPVKATFTLNSREHWSARARKRKAERRSVGLAYRNAFIRTPSFTLSGPSWKTYVVTLTRIGPRKLDSDNVQGALKAIRDEVAAQLGIDDGDPRITWKYEQAKGEYAVRVVIETAEVEAA
jgi:hypothetical protein